MKTIQLSAIGLITLAILTMSSNNYASTIVNIDARSNTPANPITLFLTAGTYNVDPIGIEQGGLYNAWDANFTDNIPSWVNHYSVSSSEFSEILVWDGKFYASDLIALANATGMDFTLVADGYVNFFNGDIYHGDNYLGMSLQVSAVPLPAAFYLMFSGLLGLGFIQRKLLLKSS